MFKKYSAAYVALAVIIFLSTLSVTRIESVGKLNAIAVSSSYVTENTPVIVIDAGHGGIDGGAVGVDGTVEKDINLSIALKLRDALTIFGFKTVMTREEDLSIHSENAETIRQKKSSDLHNRLNILNGTENSIFISIHQNYYETEKYWGTQVFYSPNDKNSKYLADELQSIISNILQPDNNRQIKEAQKNLYILYNAEKPAVMVECGFMSNRNELERLKKDAYQRKIALCVAKGIINYLETQNLRGNDNVGQS